MEPLKLVYILGFTRSGTTLVGNAVGSIDGFCNVGEMSRKLWDHLGSTRPCPCGAQLAECDFWQPVLAEALGKVPGVAERAALTASERDHLKTRNLRRFLRALPNDPDLEPELREFALTMGRIYHAAARQSGARAVIDTSKLPAYFAALRLAPWIEPYIVHVVRDPRAVAYSWQRPAKPGLTQYKPRRIAYEWVKANGAALLVDRWARDRSIVVRYEDFVTDPARVLESIVRVVGEPAGALPVVEGGLRLEPDHAVWGNPGHDFEGVVALKEDDEWLDAMPRSQRALVSVLSSPFLGRFSYPRRTPRPLPAGT